MPTFRITDSSFHGEAGCRFNINSRTTETDSDRGDFERIALDVLYKFGLINLGLVAVRVVSMILEG